MKTLGVLAVYVAAIFVSWFGASFIFGWYTDSGKVYLAALDQPTEPLLPALVNVEGEDEYYTRNWIADEKRLLLDFFVDKTIGGTISVGPIDSIQSFAKAKYGHLCDFDRKLGYAIFWQYSGTATRRIRNRYGPSATWGCRPMVSFSEPTWWAPQSRNVDLHVPEGGIRPLVSHVLNLSMAGLNRGADSKTIEAMTARISDDIANRLSYSGLKRSVGEIAFYYGPVQFLTTCLLIGCLFMLIFAGVKKIRLASESAMNLIPYVGFFGTLLGMGAALQILGEANLSDPISKAINLGPIGSKLSLAIETTKFALICFGIVTLATIFRDALIKEESE